MENLDFVALTVRAFRDAINRHLKFWCAHSYGCTGRLIGFLERLWERSTKCRVLDPRYARVKLP
jgi:hypothetical protein